DSKSPANSLLLRAIRHEGPKMPKEKLPATDIAALTEWAKMGAPWPAGGATIRAKGVITPADRAFWAFQPVKDHPPPAVKAPAWGRNAVARSLRAKLEAKGLTPARPADRRTLIRRVTYGLIGLPPTPAEVDAFLNDKQPDAYERLVERLLASPAYGE